MKAWLYDLLQNAPTVEVRVCDRMQHARLVFVHPRLRHEKLPKVVVSIESEYDS